MTAPSASHPTDILPRAIYYQIAHTLRSLLPPPVTDTPEDEARRDLAAIAHVAALRPGNADEANLACQYIAASTQALHCRQLARQFQDSPAIVLQCAAQATSMMRQARGWRTALLNAQAAREKRDADPAAREAATQAEHLALGLLAEALAVPRLPREAAEAGQTAAPASSAPSPAPRRPPQPQSTLIAEAELYAVQHRKRARLIRRFGRVPDRMNFGALAPELVHTIATGTTPILRALDEQPKRAPPRAA